MEMIQKKLDFDIEDNQLAENKEIEESDITKQNYITKRSELDKTKITKQTWSVRELYQKIINKELDLEPEYQRNIVWKPEKQISFIESLLMGIVVPPLYFVEVPGKGPLNPTRYEVVDGKQRLNSIAVFLRSELKLREQYLEYYGDLYADKTFSVLSNEFSTEMDDFASQTLDIYVITSSSPESTKYDIFSRLNKGSAPLRVNEIRKAVYHSPLITGIDAFIRDEQKNHNERYCKLFSKAKIERYEDYGIFYKAIAFYLSIDEENLVVKGYNSRPRELINTVLASFQTGKGNNNYRKVEDIPLLDILNKTIQLLEYFGGENEVYYLECCIKPAVDRTDKFNEIKSLIKDNEDIKSTFVKSIATTSNVNKRIEIVYSLIKEQ